MAEGQLGGWTQVQEQGWQGQQVQAAVLIRHCHAQPLSSLASAFVSNKGIFPDGHGCTFHVGVLGLSPSPLLITAA